MNGRQTAPARDPRALAVLALGMLLLLVRWAMGWFPGAHVSLGGMEMTDVVIYLVVPALLLPVLGEHPLAYLGVGRLWAIRWVLVGAFVCIGVSAYLLAHHAPFRGYYAAGAASGRFAVQSLVIIISIEFFFRGVLLQRPYRAFGWPALVWSTALYGLIHLGKPAVELGGSLVFGAALACLALKSGSIWYGVALHWMLAVGVVTLIAAGR